MELHYAVWGEVVEDALGVGWPVADALREVGGVDEIKGLLPEPGLLEVVDFEGAVWRDPSTALVKTWRDGLRPRTTLVG